MRKLISLLLAFMLISMCFPALAESYDTFTYYVDDFSFLLPTCGSENIIDSEPDSTFDFTSDITFTEIGINNTVTVCHGLVSYYSLSMARNFVMQMYENYGNALLYSDDIKSDVDFYSGYSIFTKNDSYSVSILTCSKSAFLIVLYGYDEEDKSKYEPLLDLIYNSITYSDGYTFQENQFDFASQTIVINANTSSPSNNFSGNEPNTSDAEKVKRFYAYLENNGIVCTDTTFTAKPDTDEGKTGITFNYQITKKADFSLYYDNGALISYGLFADPTDSYTKENLSYLLFCFCYAFADTTHDESIAYLNYLAQNLEDDEFGGITCNLTKNGYRHMLSYSLVDSWFYYIYPQEEQGQ